MEDKRNLLEFLEILVKLTEENIDFMKGKDVRDIKILGKYKDELGQVQDLINSFDFV